MATWPSDLPEMERSFEGSLSQSVEVHNVMLGPPRTRRTIGTPFTGIFKMRVFREDRDRLSKFRRDAGGDFFDFPHPVFGNIRARFSSDTDGLSFTHNIGGYYEATMDLELLG